MSRQAKLALATLAGGVLLAVLIVVLRPEPEEQPRVGGVPLVQTVAFEAGSGPLEVLGSGTVQPREEVTVAAEIPGRLIYVNPAFREGGTVGAGDVLFRIDPADYQNRVRSAQADVAAQGVAVLQAQEEVEIARRELRRYADRESGNELFARTIDDNDYASRIRPPQALQEEAAAASRSAAPIAAEPNRLATREPQLLSARAARDRAEAQLADARLALGRTVIRAPFGGIVRSEDVAVGKLVQPGQVLGSMVSVNGYEVRVSLTESTAALIPGLLDAGGSLIPAAVYSDYGGRAYRWSAYVDRADAILDPAKRTIDVFLRVPNPLLGGLPVSADGAEPGDAPAPPLLLGSFVRARITGQSDVRFAEIAAEHLRPGNVVWLVQNGKLRIVPVRVIQRTDERAYVGMPNVAPGTKLVTTTLRAPVDGMAVRLDRPARSPAAPGKAEQPADE